ncbi:MAG: hypothetical protein SOY02_01340 [Candidatus Onthovivens sp.]|nr:hypothetical protein [Candidatus Onthovivens sp.]
MEGEVVKTMGEAITSGITSCIDIFGKAVTMITDNTIAMVFIGFSLLGGAVGLFSKVKSA